MHSQKFSFPYARPLSLLLLGSASLTIRVNASQASTPSKPVELDEFTVSSSPFARSPDELHQPATVLSADRLDDVRGATLGETLDGQPGVSSTYFGPGANRPVIRGLDGDRIRILTNGIGTIDASGTSPDHAVSLDPAVVSRIEVVRGPAALLYGSAAAGGVVNVIENQVPVQEPQPGFSGLVNVQFDTAANARSGSGSLQGATETFGWQASYSRRQTDDVDIPGHAESPPDEHARPGRLENSAIDTEAGAMGLAWFWKDGRAGFAFSSFETRYGVPGHEHEPEEEGHEEDLDVLEFEILTEPVVEPFEILEEEDAHEASQVAIDMNRRRVDFAMDVTDPFAWLRNARLRAGYVDYRHTEFEGDLVGTRFDTEGWEARLDALHQPIGAIEGALGIQAQRQKSSAEGEEAFLPPTRASSWALFGVEELLTGPVRWQAGARIERQEVNVLDRSREDRSKTAFSTSAGMLWTIDPNWTLALSLARTERNPTAQEWYANGPHAATRAFEVGNPDLGKEKSSSVDLSLRRRAGAVTGALSFFHTSYDRFIFEESTGRTQDGLPVYAFLAQDARFHGAEVEAIWHLHEGEAHEFEFTLTGDFVRATNRSTDTSLPRIPPARVGLALDYHGGTWAAGIEVKRSFRQDRVAPFESETPAYTLVGAHLGYTLRLDDSTLSLYLRALNLTDEEARPHTSFLKDVAPLPGRNLIAGARLAF